MCNCITFFTDFCKSLSKSEALGELSSISSEGEESESEKGFHHPFLLKERPSSIIMNIRVSINPYMPFITNYFISQMCTISIKASYFCSGCKTIANKNVPRKNNRDFKSATIAISCLQWTTS